MMWRGKRPAAALKERLWWIDVVYPLALAVLLFTSLTYVVYSGQRQSRLGPMAEKKLLEFSLRHAGDRLPRDPRGVLVVNAEPSDIRRLGRAPGGPVPDASAAAYAKVLMRLADAGVPEAIVFWDIEAHLTDEVYCLPLIEALKHIGTRMKVLLAMPAEGYDKLPQSLRNLAPNTVLDLCVDSDMVNIECAYRADYPEFVLQTILRDLGDPPDAPPSSRRWVSTQLSSQVPGYILSLSPPDSLTMVGFSQLIEARDVSPLRGFRLAVVGPDESDAVSSASGSTYFRYVLTQYDRPGTDAEIGGTPMHIFWGQVAQMYIDKAMVNVPPWWVSVVATIALCLLVGAAMSLLGGPAALGMFLLYVATGPYVNALGIKYFQVYLPLFDGYYFGMSTFVAAGLGRLSVTAFQRWRLEAKRRLHAHAADLKGNFISLFSHNLNTPVAKMQGMLAVLTGNPATAPWRAELTEAEAMVTQLEHAIRGMLIASALEEGSLNETPRPVKALSEEFQNLMGASLRRLGLTVSLKPPAAEVDDDLYMPLVFDVRALTTVVGALAALFRVPGTRTPLSIEYRVETDDGESPRLIVTFASTQAWIPADAARRLATGTIEGPRDLKGESFFVDVSTGLALQAARRYGGRFDLQPAGAGGVLALRFNAAGAGIGVAIPLGARSP